MAKIGSRSPQKSVFSENPANHDSIKENISVNSPEARTLKAVYPHFAINSKRDSVEGSMNYTNDNSSGDELEIGAENSEKEYKTLKNVQTQIHKFTKKLKLNNWF